MRMELFGVGAPEAVLVALVAVLLFGPQGIVEVRVHVHNGRCARFAVLDVAGLSLGVVPSSVY